MNDVFTYPVNLRLDGRKCMVIGGGRVALRKTGGLLKAAARIEIIAPHLVEELDSLWRQGKIVWQKKTFTEKMTEYLDGCFLLICATDSPEINRVAAAEAKARGILVNAPGQPELSDFFVPSVLRRGKVTFTVSTEGESPALSRVLREKMAQDVPTYYGEWLDKVARIRREVKMKLPGSREREEFWRRALSVRIMELVRAGEIEQAEVELYHAVDGFGA